jgi:uncharacterized membrane protein (UPF0182 family)
MSISSTKLATWLDIAWKVGVVLLAGGVWWLNSHYVTREEYAAARHEDAAQFEAVRQQVRDVERAVLLLIEQQRANERQDAALGDHEQRLRVVERTVTTLAARETAGKQTGGTPQ